jgi:hypothetical protein
MGWNREESIKHLRKQAQLGSQGQCAKYTRQAIEAGLEGAKLPRPASAQAKDYGLGLQAAGFAPLPGMCGGFQEGDVAIIDGFEGHPAGHMAMYDGKQWISDFPQNSCVGREGGLYPGNAYATKKPEYRLYRWNPREAWPGTSR